MSTLKHGHPHFICSTKKVSLLLLIAITVTILAKLMHILISISKRMFSVGRLKNLLGEGQVELEQQQLMPGCYCH